MRVGTVGECEMDCGRRQGRGEGEEKIQEDRECAGKEEEEGRREKGDTE